MIRHRAFFPVVLLATLAVSGVGVALAPESAMAQQAEEQSSEARIAALEERITELQAIIGTLQTFTGARQRGGRAERAFDPCARA